jgi:hypothetical protein
VSNPLSIVTFGFTGALFIRVAGIGGMICGGSWWTEAMGLRDFLDKGLFFASCFFRAGAVGRAEGAGGVDCCAQATPDTIGNTIGDTIASAIASERAIAEVRLIASSALIGSSFADSILFAVSDAPLQLLFPLADMFSASIIGVDSSSVKANICSRAPGIYSA